MKVTTCGPLLFLFAAASCSTSSHQASESVEPAAAGRGALLVEIEGVRSAAGQVNLSLFDGEEGFPQDTTTVLQSATLKLTGGGVLEVRFEGLAYGDYAIAALHDENGNGVMDTGFLGVPSEGFGFSNNPTPGFGPPSFATCKFRLDRPEVTLRVEIRYF